MKKVLIAACMLASASHPASAHYRGYGYYQPDPGPAIAGAFLGFAAGAIAAGAAQPQYYAPSPAYYPPVHCWPQQVPVYDNFGNFFGYETRRVCQ